MKKNNIKRVIKWLGSPVDMKRLNARYPRHANSTLVQAAIIARNSDLLSILLQYGADVNSMDAKGCCPLFMAIPEHSFERAKILLEWGAEIVLPRNLEHAFSQGVKLGEKMKTYTNREAFILTANKEFGNSELTKLLSSELVVEGVK